MAIDAGADMVIGHHAHILKPIEIYKGKVIFYSLGNFAMEDPNDMKQDIVFKEQDMATSKSHKEMTKISGDAFAKSNRGFPLDCYLTMVVKWEVEDGKITKVSYLPAYLPEDGAPYVCMPDDPRFIEVNDYMVKIAEGQGMPAGIYRVEGDEVVLA